MRIPTHKSGTIGSIFILSFGLIGMFFLPQRILAQNYIEDFSKMYKAYQKLEDFHTLVEVAYYEGGTSQTQNQYGEVWKSGNQYKYRLDQLTMMYTDQFILAVDEEQQLIALSERSGERINSIDLVAEDFEALQEKYEKVEFVGSTNEALHYRVYTPSSVIILTEVYLDANTFLINKLEYDYNPEAYPEGTRSVVVYKGMNPNPTFGPEVFSKSGYIQKSPEGYKPSKAFESYQLLFNPKQPQ